MWASVNPLHVKTECTASQYLETFSNFHCHIICFQHEKLHSNEYKQAQYCYRNS